MNLFHVMKALRVTRKVRKSIQNRFTHLRRDIEGEEAFKALGHSLEESGLMFEDDEFPAELSSIFSDPDEIEKSSIPNACQLKDEIQWKRPHEMGDVDIKAEVFVDGVDPEDIHQGVVGDCYFLAALSLCATREVLIDDLLVYAYAHIGLFGVKFYFEGRWHTITVDDRFPCKLKDGKWIPIFCNFSEGAKEIWAMVIEKAWAKLNGGYEAIDEGICEDALVYLTGGVSCTLIFQECQKQIQNGEMWTLLKKQLGGNSHHVGVFLSASVFERGVEEDEEKKRQTGLIASHAYSLLDLQIVDGHSLVKLRNPWGNFEWSGDWSDHSKLWTPERKNMVEFVAEDDGSFWMSFKDFTQHFDMVGYCKTIDPSWQTVVRNINFTEKLCGGPMHDDILLNPSFILRNEDEIVWLNLEQKDARLKCNNGYMKCHILICKKPENLDRFDPYDTVVPIISMPCQRTLLIELNLPPTEGPYIVICALWLKGVTQEMFVSCHSPQAVTFEPLDTIEILTKRGIKLNEIETLPKPSMDCATCKQSIVQSDLMNLMGLNWHNNEYCFRCSECSVPFDFDLNSSMCHSVNFAGGEWRGYCWTCYDKNFGVNCIFCKKRLNISVYETSCVISVPHKGFLHFDCKPGYEESMLPECMQCKKPIDPSQKTESFSLEAGGAVHYHCLEQYNHVYSQKCAQCEELILPILGFRSGKYFIFNNDIIHEECVDKYRFINEKICIYCYTTIGRAEKLKRVKGKGYVHRKCLPMLQRKLCGLSKDEPLDCIQCKKSIGDLKKFYKIEDKGLVHVDCLDAYKSKHISNCVHCHKPIEESELFSSLAYPINNEKDSDLIHVECSREYLKSEARICSRCHKVVCWTEGNFSGRFVTFIEGTDDNGEPITINIHEECLTPEEIFFE